MGNYDLSTPFLALVQDWKALIDSLWTRWQKNESPQTQNIVIFAKFCTFVINATKSYNLSANNKSKKYYWHFQDKTESTSRTRVVALWKVQVSVIRMPWNVVSYNLESLLTYVLLVFQLLPLLLECWCNRIVNFFLKGKWKWFHCYWKTDHKKQCFFFKSFITTKFKISQIALLFEDCSSTNR